MWIISFKTQKQIFVFESRFKPFNQHRTQWPTWLQKHPVIHNFPISFFTINCQICIGERRKNKKKCVSLYAKIVVYGIHRLGGVACWPFFACHAPLPKFIYWNPGDDNLSSATTAKTSPASDVKLNKNVKLKSLFKLSALKKTFKENKKRKMKQVKTETDILLLHNKWFNEVKTENIYHSP